VSVTLRDIYGLFQQVLNLISWKMYTAQKCTEVDLPANRKASYNCYAQGLLRSHVHGLYLQTNSNIRLLYRWQFISGLPINITVCDLKLPLKIIPAITLQD